MKLNIRKGPSRWNNDYVFKNEWVVCLIPLTNIIPVLFVIGVLETIINLCPICNTVNLPNWSFYLFVGGVAFSIYLFMAKILFAYLKGSGILIYSPKQPTNREDKQ